MNLFDSDRGFSLMEVTLAVFLTAGGLLILFSLFPLGLRESTLAGTDTQEAMFADYYLGMLESKSMSITNYSDWIKGNFDVDGFSLHGRWGLSDPPVPFPVKSTDLVLRYEATWISLPPDRHRVVLTVKGGRYGRELDSDAKTYVTELVFLGM